MLTKTVNPFSLEREILDIKNREIIYMLWDECIEKTFYKHICEGENFIYLNSKNILYITTAQIVLYYLNKDPKNIVLLQKCLQQHMKVIQFVYLRCFPEIYFLIDKQGINLKSESLLTFKVWKDKKIFPVQQQPTSTAENISSVSIDENEENAVSTQNFATLYGLNVDEKKANRKILGEKNTAELKRSRKPQTSEKELWERLDTLNKKFAAAKEHNKKNKPKKKLVG